MPLVLSRHNCCYTSVINGLSFACLTFKDDELQPISWLIYAYNNVIHGFSASLFFNELEHVKRHQGFVPARNDTKFTYHTTYTPEFLNLNDLNGFWHVSNYGKDVIFDMIDLVYGQKV